MHPQTVIALPRFTHTFVLLSLQVPSVDIVIQLINVMLKPKPNIDLTNQNKTLCLSQLKKCFKQFFVKRLLGPVSCPHKCKTVKYCYSCGDIWSAQRHKYLSTNTYTQILPCPKGLWTQRKHGTETYGTVQAVLLFGIHTVWETTGSALIWQQSNAPVIFNKSLRNKYGVTKVNMV